VCEGGAAEPSALDVALSLPSDGQAPPVFRMDDRIFGSPGMAKLISAAQAVDERGPLELTRRVLDDVLELEAARPAIGTMTLRYRARSVGVGDRGARYGLRHDATGIGGLGAYFIVLPDSQHPYRLAIEWGPPACTAPAGALRSMSTFGDGPDPAWTSGLLEKLRNGSYFVGHPAVAPFDRGDLRVRSAWFGRPSFDPAEAATWAARAFEAERAFFADDNTDPYRIFGRVLPEMGERSNGMGQPSSFIIAIGPSTPFGPRLRINIAHEMMHRWIGLGLRLAGPEGSAFWFTEGFTVHYARSLMLRAGLISPDEFLADLGGTTARHFANPHAGATNETIRRGFFDDDALSVVPYVRGSLYAAELDAAIRKASGGARSLDDLMRELYRAAQAAPENEAGLHELPEAAFRQALLRELGRPAVDRFEAVIARGETPAPPSDAFGPCFERASRSFAVFAIGFDEKRSRVEPKAIRKLVAGSAAAKAGLREGDALVSIESSPLFADKEAVVTVKRGGKEIIVRYLPASSGPRRQGFEWVRAKGVPDDRCAGP